MNATAQPVRSALDNLTVDEWNEHDPDGFAAAAERCAKDDLATIAAELVCDTGAGMFWRSVLRRRMERELFLQVQELEPWVLRWEARTSED